MSISRASFIFFVMVIALSVGCRTAEVRQAKPEAREVTDGLGRVVRVPQKIDRVISLAPSVTEMVFAVAAGDKLVGVTTYCNYPEPATKIEKIGDTQTPNIERIVALKPQVVFVSTASQLEAFSMTLDQQGIAVYVINATSLEEVFNNLVTLGDLLGTQQSADELVANLAGRANAISHIANFDAAGAPIADNKKPRVFVQISNEPLFTIGKDSYLTELIEQAGGISATKDVPSAYPKLSKETAAALDPDVIFLSDSDDNREPSGAIKTSKAVRNGRVYKINADIISRPGPRLVDALEEIATKLRAE